MLIYIIIVSLAVVFIMLARHLPDILDDGDSQQYLMPLVNRIKNAYQHIGRSPLERAEQYIKILDYKSAENILIDEINKNPRNSRAYHKIGIIYLINKEFNLASEIYKKATSLDTNKSEYWNNLSYSYFMQKKYSDALDAIKISLSLDSSKPERWMNAILFLEKMGRNEDIYNLAKEAVKKGIIDARIVERARII